MCPAEAVGHLLNLCAEQGRSAPPSGAARHLPVGISRTVSPGSVGGGEGEDGVEDGDGGADACHAFETEAAAAVFVADGDVARVHL